jgi:hypothetical protein
MTAGSAMKKRITARGNTRKARAKRATFTQARRMPLWMR